MIEKVVKRGGEIVDVDKNKIIQAIIKAMEECDNIDEELAIKIADSIINSSKNTIGVEEIQDIIESKLMASKCKDVAKAFILFREERTRIREGKADLTKLYAEKLLAKKIQNQNANVDEYSFGGRKGEANDVMLKNYALNYCMSDLARENHLSNRIYTHDLNSFATGEHNCLSVPFDHLLANGFTTRQTDVRPANSINTAFQLVAVIFQIQSLCQFGGVSATHLDWTMIPYVRKSFHKHFKDGLIYLYKEDEYTIKDDVLPIDSEEYKYFSKAYKYAMDMTKRELKQAVEGMYHNLNTLQSRSGNQLPFSSINFGTATSTEGRMVIKALLDGCYNGVGSLHQTSIFPCVIFQLGKGINRKLGDPNYDLFQYALKCTAKRLYPNYANIDWSGNEGYDKNDPKTFFSTMGCRTANGYDINAEEGQNPQLKDGRGNIAPVTIILPTIAMECWKEWCNEEEQRYDIDITPDMNIEDYFLKVLDNVIEEARIQLIERFEWICSQDPKSASFMYDNNTMFGYHKEEGIYSALKHGTLAIGQLGLAECLQILIGCDHTTERGMEFAKKIEQLYKDKCAKFKEEDKLNFGVYYTPAENLCYTAMNKFKKEYGIFPNVSENDYFTNSMHVPVWHKMTAIEKIDIESQLTGYSSAGCITYVELTGSVKQNLIGLEELVNYAMDKDIPYFAINIPDDMCMDCGYHDEVENECPKCHSKNIRRLRRVTGYLSTDYKHFNKGKQQEVEMRVKHG